MVRVVVLPLVGRQVHGWMDTTGHLQLMAERDVNGVLAESPQVAFTTNGSRVGSEINHPSPPHPIVAPQLKGSLNAKRKNSFNILND
jgi:hypothetical protein